MMPKSAVAVPPNKQSGPRNLAKKERLSAKYMATRASQRKRPPATDGGSDFDVVLSEAPVADSASLVGVRSERKKSDLEPEQSRSLPGETTPFERDACGAPYVIARARCVTDARCLPLRMYRLVEL